MFRLLIIFAVVALVAAIVGFAVPGAAISSLARPVFWVFAFLFVIALFLALFGVRAPRT